MEERRAACAGADAGARDQVAQAIEGYAASQARAIRTATQYLPFTGGSAARDAYCATHWED